MVNREQLRRAGLRAYELGRLRSAARVAWVLVPTVAACAIGTGAGGPCACAGVLLLSASVYLRWRDRSGANAVRDGLLAGALPLIMGLVATQVAQSCAGEVSISWCIAACGAAGVPSGAWLGARLARSAVPTSSWLATSGIAVLAASVGCLGFGLAGILGVAAGLGTGITSSRLLSPSSA